MLDLLFFIIDALQPSTYLLWNFPINTVLISIYLCIGCIALLVDGIHSLLNLCFESETFWIKWLDERKWIACNYLAVIVLKTTIWYTACSLTVLLSISANKNATLVYLCVTV